MNMKNNNVEFAFFGTPHFAVCVLEEMEKGGMLPSLVVTAPDRPAGRGMKLTPPPVKVWAEKHGIPILQPEKLDKEFIYSLQTTGYSLFIVAAYGKIIPKEILEIPEYGTLNVHPSLLPKYRGATPIPSAILAGDTETGVTIMLMDEKMDHGPILGTRNYELGMMENTEQLGEKLFRMGGEMLVDVIPKWVVRGIAPQEQDHDKATYTKKISKEDGLLDLNAGAEKNWRKFRAHKPWPGSYFFEDRGGKNVRMKITGAVLENGKFIVKKVIPEGGKGVNYLHGSVK